jgi:hypothetical protein
MRKLGRTGIEVSAYRLGTMVFGEMGDPDHDDCVRMIHRALDATAAIIGPRTRDQPDDQLDDLLVGATHARGDDILDKIDATVPPGTGIGPLDVSCVPPSLTHPHGPAPTPVPRTSRRVSVRMP